ncbi:hypothetical protein PZE06_10960 [Robertmurraya sp. DFI.2.37]|uniref:hypothetical protein n=1 Tax=Robertmurraya sp. DFI.2.37 TaxID=3031819 RepID=UPI001248456F|nr:hypothetical protein [Robertmurraya sp. DFI.2.37]MDF1508710.1 hypothetical protein [Robertmurraya sp. DFI.2.37]
MSNQVSAYFRKKAAEKAAADIPKSKKSLILQVISKSSGTFTIGKWKIDKDESGHTGYNGNKRAWKVGNTSTKRIASLDKYENIIGD